MCTGRTVVLWYFKWKFSKLNHKRGIEKTLSLEINYKINRHAWFISRVAIKTCYKWDDLEEHQFVPSQFWKLEIQNWGVGRAMLPLKPLGENPTLPFATSSSLRCSLVCGCITLISASVFIWSSSLGVSQLLCLLSCSENDTSHIGWQDTLISSF